MMKAASQVMLVFAHTENHGLSFTKGMGLNKTMPRRTSRCVAAPPRATAPWMDCAAAPKKKPLVAAEPSGAMAGRR